MKRPQFLDLVANAVRSSNRPEIARVDTILESVDSPVGLTVTTAGGTVYRLRALCLDSARTSSPASSRLEPEVPAGE